MAKRDVSYGEEGLMHLGMLVLILVAACLTIGVGATIYQIWHISAQVDALTLRPISQTYFNAPNSNDNAPTFCELRNGSCKN